MVKSNMQAVFENEEEMMFGYTIIRKAELHEYRKAYCTRQRVIDCHRWFAHFKDLDIIWEYLLAETYFGDIGSCRDKYEKARTRA